MSGGYSARCENPPRRSRRDRRGLSPDSLLERLRRAQRGLVEEKGWRVAGLDTS